MGNHFNSSALLWRFRDEYLNSGHYFLQVSPPFADLSWLDRNSDQSLQSCMKAILTVGAVLNGDVMHAVPLANETRLSIQDMFDVVNPHVAATYHLLRSVYNMIGDQEKEHWYNTNAMRMSEALLKKYKTRRIN